MVAFYAIPCRKTQETWECCFERCSTISSANRYITIKYWKSSNIFRHLLLFNAWTWTLQNLRYVISIAAFTGPQTKTRSSPERIGGLILKQIRKYPSWKWAVTLPSRYVVESYIFMFSPFGLIWDDLGMVQIFRSPSSPFLPRASPIAMEDCWCWPATEVECCRGGWQGPNWNFQFRLFHSL